jgi:hypothetical protein
VWLDDLRLARREEPGPLRQVLQRVPGRAEAHGQPRKRGVPRRGGVGAAVAAVHQRPRRQLRVARLLLLLMIELMMIELLMIELLLLLLLLEEEVRMVLVVLRVPLLPVRVILPGRAARGGGGGRGSKTAAAAAAAATAGANVVLVAKPVRAVVAGRRPHRVRVAAAAAVRHAAMIPRGARAPVRLWLALPLLRGGTALVVPIAVLLLRTLLLMLLLMMLLLRIALPSWRRAVAAARAARRR